MLRLILCAFYDDIKKYDKYPNGGFHPKGNPRIEKREEKYYININKICLIK
jgi:hypothetical protein